MAAPPQPYGGNGGGFAPSEFQGTVEGMPRHGHGGGSMSGGSGMVSQRTGHQPPEFPDLRLTIRHWKGGHRTRDGQGGSVIVPLTHLVLVHMDRGIELHPREVFLDEEPDDLTNEMQLHIVQKCKNLSYGGPQALQLIAKFEDGEHAPHSESWFGTYTAAPEGGSYGRSSMAGMSHHGLRDPQNVNAMVARGVLEYMDRAIRIQEHAVGSILNENAALRVENGAHRANSRMILEQQQDLMNQQDERDEKRNLAKWKLASFDVMLKKVMSIAPIVAVGVKRALYTWSETRLKDHRHKKAIAAGVKPKDIDPRERRALSILERVMNAAHESGAAKDMGQFANILGGLGVDGKTIDELMDVATELTIEKMEKEITETARKDMNDLTGISSLTDLLPKEPTVQKVYNKDGGEMGGGGK